MQDAMDALRRSPPIKAPSLKLPSLKRGGAKDAALVGLEIEAGSVAAAEVRANGAARLTATAIAPLPPGAFHDGEVVDPGALAAVLRSLFAEHKLSRRVRLGIANQRVVVRTLRLPAIDDPKELEAAVRFEAQEQIPMPIDQAVLDHRVVGGVPAAEGAARADRRGGRRRPPRHDRSDAPAAAGRRPRAGRGRPLRLRPDPRPRRAGGHRARPRPRRRARRSARFGRPLLQRRRRHQPGDRQGALLPLHPSLAGRPRGRRNQPRRHDRPEPGARPDVA